MRIQHNIPAMNSYRNYNNNNKKLGRNLEKLSSGYAINRAGDDAAGLAISEKMRAQITGIEVASKNAKDGISVVQTAEGALTEVHDMLNRMFALAEQANNGIYKAEERQKLQSEINQLATEIDRIGDSTNFNGMKLLDGTLADAPVPDVKALDNPTPNSDPKIEGVSFTWSTNATTEVKQAFNKVSKDTASKIKIDTEFIAKSAGDATRTADGATLVVDLGTQLTGKYTIKSATISKSDVASATGQWGGNEAGKSAVMTASLNQTQIKGGTVTMLIQDSAGVEVGTLSFRYGEINMSTSTKQGKAANVAPTAKGTISAANERIELAGKDDSNEAVTHAPLGLQIGDSTNAYDKMLISIDSMKADSLGVNALNIIDAPGNAMANVIDAIEKVSVQRGTLGAYQNRLDHTLNNLSVMRENIQDAEATIRDTDMAEEMMKYTKNSILVQSAQAMLAQANQLPQGVLSLLQ